MSDDKKNEKKIAKERKSILFWLKATEEDEKKLEAADGQKKIEKYIKTVKQDKDYIRQSVNNVLKLGGNVDDIMAGLTESHQKIWNEMFGNADSDDIAIEKEIQRIKKMLNEDLKEAMEKYNYDPEEPIETRYKNKLFKAETDVGRCMLNAGDESLKDSMYYRECWNYDRDYEKTKDQYFTKEEQGLIEKCIQSRLEERDFLRQKNAFMYNLGLSIQKTAVKIGEWGDITQARMWADNLSKEAFPKAVKDIEGRKLSKEELAEKSKAMTRRYIQFIGDPKAIEEAMNHDREAEAEAERLLNELRSSADEARPLLSGRDRREIEETLEAVESEVEGQGVLAYKLLEDKLGYEKALFIALYKHDSNKEDRRELLTGYSFEELGL